jgi:hypothetical protein
MEDARIRTNQPHFPAGSRQLGAIYTPAVAIAVLAWVISGEAVRFLAVLVIATPAHCLSPFPSRSSGPFLAARRSIVKEPPCQQQRTPHRDFRQNGTLTYGEPKLTEKSSRRVSRKKRC